jgi:hypothetical protein
MRGNSGARLDFTGEWVLKTCSDASQQNEWFDLARNLPTTNGVRIPSTRLVGDDSYQIEFIDGIAGTHSSSTLIISALIDQILLWAQCASPRPLLTWQDYMDRVYNYHIAPAHCPTLYYFFNLVNSLPITLPPPTFSHGDLTLENVIITSGWNELVLIDPNFKSDLFQSYILDFGKLLQSTNSNYHHRFNSNPGVDLQPHNKLLIKKLRQLGILRECLVAEITHIIRLRRYQPACMLKTVDNLLSHLIHDLKKL